MGYILIITNQLLRDQKQLAGDPPLPPLVIWLPKGTLVALWTSVNIIISLDLSYKKWKFNDVHGPTNMVIIGI